MSRPNTPSAANASNRDHLRAYLSGVLTSLASAKVIPPNASVTEIIGTLAGKFASDVWADATWVVAETARVFGAMGLRMGVAKVATLVEDKAAATKSPLATGAAKVATQAFSGLVELAVAELTSPSKPKR